MTKVKLDLSQSQISKLRNKHPVQVRYEQIGSGVDIDFNDSNLNKLKRAFHSGKGARISLSNDEIEMSGGSLGRKIRRAANKAQKHAKKARNITRKIKEGMDKYEFIEDLGIPVVSDAYGAVHAGVTAANRGIESGYKMGDSAKKGNVAGVMRSGRDMRDNYDENIRGSGSNPYIPKRKKQTKSGGSFKALGGSFKATGGAYRGSSYKALGGGTVKLDTTESNFVNPNHNSFNPGGVTSYKEIMYGKGTSKKIVCPTCGR